MTQIQSKRNKLVTVVLAVWFLFGAAGLLVPTQALAAKAKNEKTIGYVNRQQFFAAYPGIQEIMNRI